MTRFLTLTLLLTAALFPAVAQTTAPEKNLQQTLIETYNAWRTSMLKGDAAAWTKHTASYRRAITRNNIVSQKLKFPDALFQVPIKPASIEGLTPIQAREVGRTSQLVFYGQINVGLKLPEGTELPNSLLLLKFIKDRDTWKFNTLSLLNLNGADDIKRQIAAKDYSFLNIGNFAPPGYVPPVPRPCPAPDYVSQIQITSFGYDTTVTINGVSKHRVSDTATSELILGGLKNSQNKVTITSKPIARTPSDNPEDNDIPDKLEITVFATDDKDSTRAHKSWHYEPKKVLPNYSGIFFAMPR